jgi:hypothetical protein
MRRLLLTGLLVAAWGIPAVTVASGPGLLQDSQGTTGTLYDFGGVKLYQDSRGTTGTVYDFGAVQQYQFTSPSGETQSGTIYNFGGTKLSPVVPLPQTPATPQYPVLPYGGGMAPQSHPGGGHWRGGTGR